MNDVLLKYLPKKAIPYCLKLIKSTNTHLKVVNKRHSKHGDFRVMPDGTYQITINANLNKYRFLITLIHEIAHLVTYEKYGACVKPHGEQWKKSFKDLMLPLLTVNIFPERALPTLSKHFKNPKASSDTDSELCILLKRYDCNQDKDYLCDIPQSGIFRLHNGRMFVKYGKSVKRYKCKEISTGKVYLFNPNAEVEYIKNSPSNDS